MEWGCETQCQGAGCGVQDTHQGGGTYLRVNGMEWSADSDGVVGMEQSVELNRVVMGLQSLESEEVWSMGAGAGVL